MNNPVLWVVIPCYNEEEVLPITAPLFLNKIASLSENGTISKESKILFVDDGSNDNTWSIISELSKRDKRYIGIRQSRNRGHQNAVLAGMMEAIEQCDIIISIDCDGQDDIDAMDRMVEAYLDGCEIVYGVRSSRESDTWFKRNSGQMLYKLLNKMGADVVYNHADYRLVGSKALKSFSDFKEVNLFLRGMFPLVGYKSTSIYYERHERFAGKSKYPINKMIALAIDGITSLSVKPISIIALIGALVSLMGVAGVIYVIALALAGKTVTGWASLVCIILFMEGIQLVSLGVIGQYVGKTYLETKRRPRYIISDRTFDK